MNIEEEKIQRFGNILVDMFHFLALFVLSYTASKYGRPEDDVNRGREP